MDLYFNNKYLTTLNVEDITEYIETSLLLRETHYYLLQNGKKISVEDIKFGNNVHVIPRLFGGKGGFGSMLRAIGAQIEKTTNREACRDLSGRRLRDINEEKRLKAWIDSQNTRDQEAADRKQKKLERLCQKPKHEFKDETYDKERSALPERLEDAVSQGLAAASGVKRKSDTEVKVVKKKKKALWVDDGISSCSDSEEDEDEEKQSLPVENRNSGDDSSSSVEKKNVNVESVEETNEAEEKLSTPVENSNAGDESGSREEKKNANVESGEETNSTVENGEKV